MKVIAEGIRSIFLWISIFIYEMISILYDMFEKLCKSRILDSEILNSLSQRIGLLLGVVMLFIVSFSVIQMILEPEKLTDKEKGIGNIAKKIILVIVMLGTSTAAFNMLYGVQKTIIDSHIISKFLLPNTETNLENFGGVLSSELFTAFFKPTNPNDSKHNRDIENLKYDIINYNDFDIATKIVNDGVEEFLLWSWGTFEIDFNWLLSPLLGLGALYFLFTYCITVGTRTIQLAFLEIISPMAIISYLSPKKDTMFEKWWKLYFATYIDAFIRIIIINLAVFLIATLLSSDMTSTFWNSVGGENFWIKIFMILAILTFAKKAPDLLKDLFPAGASKLGLGVNSPKQLFSNMLGGNYVESGLKRGWGAVRVGTGTAIGNVRRVAGKLMSTAPNYNALKKENAALINGLNEAIESGDDVAEAIIRGQLATNSKELAKSRLERRKWIIRGFTGLAGGLAGGAMAGLGTKDKGSRDRQIKVKTDRAKSNWKLQDAGYGYKERIEDMERQFLYMDTNLEQRADSTDSYISNLEMQINELHRKASQDGYTVPNIQKAKVNLEKGEYVWYVNGNERQGSLNDMFTELSITNSEQQKNITEYVKLLDLKGKAKSNSSALHQRDNEKKNK